MLLLVFVETVVIFPLYGTYNVSYLYAMNRQKKTRQTDKEIDRQKHESTQIGPTYVLKQY